jgi:hypothetical protein
VMAPGERCGALPRRPDELCGAMPRGQGLGPSGRGS